ncbi:anti-anti-sigma factor [Allocatelliglobosispora scoriae]|uniref:Anti-anti-sigma factor n=1 Tax=Allocatelliglobosispora scoriae TaxID=643052 RepID=A0A841C2A0_9ACTN|nr:STAS domain-containing protein [Allocatelliglobosispora scoriae]MBB5873429.1 anti-anti-sigma factor [Allocatelliglobosispora scoriae]
MSGRLTTHVSRGPAHTVVAVAGDCDLAGREELTATLLAAVADARIVTVDLSDVEFLDSSGIHALVTAHHAAVQATRRLYATGATGVVAQVLELTGVAELLAPPASAGADS